MTIRTLGEYDRHRPQTLRRHRSDLSPSFRTGLPPAQLQTGQREFPESHVWTLTLLLIGWLVLCVRWITSLSCFISSSPTTLPQLKSYNHLLVLSHTDALPLHHLQILQPAKHIMLNPKSGLHAELGIFFDGERFGLEFLKRTWRVQVHDEIGPSFDLES